MCGMPQHWQILVPRLQQRQKLPWPLYHRHNLAPTILSNTLVKFLFNHDASWDAWSKLAKPVNCCRFNLLQNAPLLERGTRTKSTASACTSSSSLECIPGELLDMIFDATLENKDIVALGLCSQTLWQHMVKRVERTYRTAAAPWAGAEIACMEWHSKDLPEPFEKDNLAVKSVTSRVEDEHQPAAWGFNYGAQNEFTQPENPRDAWRSALYFHRETADVPEACWPRLEEDVLCGYLFPTSTSFLVEGRLGWVLRNLTTREYVRLCCASSENCKKGGGRDSVVMLVDDANAPWLRLDDVLIMRIYWSSIPIYGLDIERGLDLRRGRWAGHCFEVVMLEYATSTRSSAESAESADEEGCWKDITADIVSEAHELRWKIRSLHDDSY